MGKQKNRFDQVSVCKIVCRIPCGRITTYGAIAGSLGKEPGKAGRAVGAMIKALGRKHSLDEVPVHRVVNGKGCIPKEENAEMLKKEGVRIYRKNGRLQVQDFKKYFWDPQQE